MAHVTALLLGEGSQHEAAAEVLGRQLRAPDAVAVGASWAAASRAAEARSGDAWLWLIEPGALPAPDALAHLLRAVETAPSVAVAGCKQVGAADDALLIDVGFTTSPAGAVVTGIGFNEVDQGQYDDRSDVMAVRLPGALVRADVWRHVGPPADGLHEAAAALEFCRRVRLAGHRVVVVPQAVVERAGAEPATRIDRFSAVRLRLIRARAWAVLPVLLWTLLVAPLRALWRLTIKQPRRAWEELLAPLSALTRPGPWWTARRRVRRVRAVPLATLGRLDATPAQVWRQRRDDLITFLFWSGPPAVSVETDSSADPSAGPAAASSAGPAADASGASAVDSSVGPAADAAAGTGRAGPVSRRGSRRGSHPVSYPVSRPVSRRARAWALGAVLFVTTTTALLALRHALPWGGAGGADGDGSGTALTGPALLPAPERAGDVWQLFRTVWRPVGLGVHAVADPLLAVLAGAAVITGGSARTAVDVLMIGAVPLAALSAWIAAGAITRSVLLRGWASLAWAAAPALLVSVGEGHLGTVVAHVVLPLFLLALARAVGHGATSSSRAASDREVSGREVSGREVSGRGPGGRPSLTAAAWAGLTGTVVLAGAPSLAVPMVLLVLVAGLLGRGTRWPLLVVAAVPAVLLLPWWAAVGSDPRLLLADPADPTRTGPAAPDAWWHLLGLPVDPSQLRTGWLGQLLPGTTAGHPNAGWLVVVIAGATLVLAMIVALLGATGRRFRLVAVSLGAAVLGLEVAVLAARVNVGADDAGAVRGWTGAGVSWFTLGVLVAAVTAARVMRRRVSLRPLGAALGVAPLLLLGGWAYQGWAHGVGLHRVSADTVPEVAALEAEGPAATRTLVVRLRAGVDAAGSSEPGGFTWAVQRFAGPRLGADSAAASARRESMLAARDRDDAPAEARVRETDLVTPLLSDLVSDSGVDVRPRLAALAIGSIQVLPPLDDRVVLALDASPGLARSGRVDGSLVWRVDLAAGEGEVTRPARARIVAPDGAVEAIVPSDGTRVEADVAAGAEGRRVVLAERADGRWRATFDGRELAPEAVDGWAMAFTLPSGPGRLVVDVPEGPGWVDGARLVVLLLAVLLAVPVPRLGRRIGGPPRVSRAIPRQDLDERQGRRPAGAHLGTDEAADRWLGPQQRSGEHDGAAGEEVGSGGGSGVGSGVGSGGDRDTDVREPALSSVSRGVGAVDPPGPARRREPGSDT